MRAERMWNMFWPIALVVLSNTFYNICTKSTPENANAFLSLAVTYLVAAAGALVLFFFAKDRAPILRELGNLNWTAFALAASVLALEYGYIMIYRAGWQVSAASIVANISLACVLVFVGLLLYKENITIRQLIGMVVCCVGLVLITKK